MDATGFRVRAPSVHELVGYVNGIALRSPLTATVAAWLVAPGTWVQRGAPVLLVETEEEATTS